MTTIKPLALTPFTTTELKPHGWMRRQLEIQAAGLAGNLDKIWPDVADSSWIGGAHEAWERVPYWLDGFIPLAFLLEDENLIARARKYINAILERQQPDGWLCPCDEKKRARYDTWALELISKVLVLWYDCTEDARIPDVLYRAMKNFDHHTDRHLVLDWGSARWFEILFALYRLYEWYPEEWIIGLCDKMATAGTDWRNVFEYWQYQKPRFGGPTWGLLHHVVNQAMMLKSRALYSRRTGEDPETFVNKALEMLEQYHGQPYGIFSGDECLAGTSPIQGTELCAVVEAMFSYETLLSITGNTHWADRAEFLGFNALPATCSPDMWTHQYLQLANQKACTIMPREKVQYTTNNGEAHLYGLEPHFGCCTANMGQGFPKLALSAFMRTEKGVASTVLVPSVLNTDVNGTNVQITLDTQYPFRQTLTYTVAAASPVEFTLSIRIPGFAKNATVDGKTAPVGQFFNICRTWSEITTVVVELDFTVEMCKGYDEMYSVRRGPLLYALPIGDEWHPLEYEKHGVMRKFPYCDYEILPTTPFAFGFTDSQFDYVECEGEGDFLFAPKGAMTALETELAPIDWGEVDGHCLASPRSRRAIGAPQRLRLIPYGCTNLRMTVLPRVEKD
ncbi:MAG: glycoside hydrolase family 127 protein [Clostridia bacterium]|nr:glycoside hydrolase family 127 protein [Clostridia bacterium]